MPAAPVLLANGRILRAHDLAALLELGHADVAADTFTDIGQPAFGDLVGQEWVRDRGACCADDVEHAGFNQRDHVIGAGKPAVADNGNAGAEDRFSLLDEGCHPAGFAKARHARILAPLGVVADFQRDRIDHPLGANFLQHANAVLMRLDALGPVQRVHLEARRDRAAIAELALQRL